MNHIMIQVLLLLTLCFISISANQLHLKREEGQCLSNFFQSSLGSCSPCAQASQQQCTVCSIYQYDWIHFKCRRKTQDQIFIKQLQKHVTQQYQALQTNSPACQSTSNLKECSNCPSFFFNKETQTCQKCSSAKIKQHCSRCTQYIFNQLITECQLSQKSRLLQSCSVANCLNCSTISNSVCQVCNDNYTLINSGCQLCSNLITNCLTCPNSTFCSECQSNFTIQTNGSCSICQLSNCLTCVPVNGLNTCISCTSNFTVINSSCVSCSTIIPNCQACTNSTFCYNCAIGFTGQANGSCLACTLPNCLNCLTINYVSTCYLCSETYYLAQNNSCIICSNLVSRCFTCTSAGCLTCAANYTMLTGICICSMINCITCRIVNNIDTCLTCASNFTVVNSSCFLCSTLINYCLLCNNATNCLQCFPTFLLSNGQSCVCGVNQTNYNNSCLQCQSLFVGCISCTPSICKICGTNYTLTSDSLCGCNLTNCITCQVQNSSKVCINCVTNFLPVNNTCFACLVLIQNCLSCNQINYCSICQQNYTLLNNGSCLKCSINLCISCVFYNTTATCQQCVNNSYALSNNSCVACSVIILKCLTCQGSVCLSCMSNYTLRSDGTCGCILPYCTSCIINSSNINTCLSCDSNHTLSNNSCLSCVNVTAHCLECQGTICLKCDYNYSLMVNGTCSPCNIANCYSCLNNTGILICSQCLTGFMLENNTCAQCSSQLTNCLQCDNQICLLCATNFTLQNGSCVCQLSYCLSCQTVNNVSTCLSCLPGYIVSTGICMTCSMIVPYCITCNNLICISCQLGYLLLSNNTCNPCNISNCSTCVINNNSLFCLQCFSGYALVNNTCSICSSVFPRCTNCTSLACTSCLTNYILLSGGSCQCQMNNCTNCVILNNIDTCLSCNSTYILLNNNCILCSIFLSFCSICSSTTQCLTCQPNYALQSNGSCIGCSLPNCLSCSNINSQYVCLGCANTYVATSSSVCTLCSSILSNCLTCNNIQACLTCQSGYLLRSDGLCWLCPITGCVSCSLQNNNYACLNCSLGYFLNSSSCTSCISKYIGCLTCLSTGCVSCSTGYTLLNSSCFSCSSSFPNCLICSVFNNSVYCSQCAAGYQLQSDGVCRISCLSLTNSSSNISCLCSSGQYLQNGSCANCGTNCQICNSTVCLQCYPGFGISSNINTSSQANCVSCSSNCLSCTSNSSCLICQQLFSLINGFCQYSGIYNMFSNNNMSLLCPGRCASCTIVNQAVSCLTLAVGYTVQSATVLRCNISCLTCSSANINICLTCPDSLYLNGTNCIACPIFCRKCKAVATNLGSACIECNRGFAIGTDGSCQACTSYCNNCSLSGPSSCDYGYCFSGYGLSQGLCASCLNDCSICDFTNSLNCLGCSSGTYLFNNNCYLCSQNCQVCTSNTICTVCLPGYELVNSNCLIKLSFPCSVSTQGVCMSCYGGYALINGQCIPSIICNLTAVCTSCQVNYYLNNGLCLPCPINSSCLQCDPSNPLLCITCQNGYYESSGQCINCSFTCLSCLGPNQCKIAAIGYYIQIANGLPTGNVLQCDSLCATCLDSPNKCTSCYQNFTLNGSKCNSVVFVEFSLVLNPSQIISGWNGMSTDQMNLAILNNYGKLYYALLAATNMTLTPDLLTINNLASGSLLASGSVSSTNTVNPNQAMSNLGTALQNSGTSNLQVISSSVSLSTSNSNSSPSSNGDTSSSSSSSNGGLIAGIIIVTIIAAALLVILFIIWYKYKKGKEGNQSNNQNIQTNNTPVPLYISNEEKVAALKSTSPKTKRRKSKKSEARSQEYQQSSISIDKP